MKSLATEIKWAFIFILAALLWMLLEKLVGLHTEHIDKHAIYTNLFAIVAIAIYVLALKEKKRKDYNGQMSWKQGFISGLIISVIIAILSPLAQWITSTLITPEYFPNVIEYVVNSGKMTQADAEIYFSLKSYVLQATIGALVMGAITSAIVSIFVRTKKA